MNREFNMKLKKAKVQKTRTKTEEKDSGEQKLILKGGSNMIGTDWQLWFKKKF